MGFMPDYDHILIGIRIVVVASPLLLTAVVRATCFLDWDDSQEMSSRGVSLSTPLLVAFFQERPEPARSGLWVWVVYRVSDAGLLLASVVMHHLRGGGDFDKLLGTIPWPEAHASIPEQQAVVVGLLLLAAVAGTSAPV